MTITNQRKVLLTAAGPSMRPLLEKFSLPRFKRFARAYGYEVVVEQLTTDGPAAAKQARWAKIPAIQAQLERAQLVLWMDADAIIRRFDEDIAGHLRPGCFQSLMMESIPADDNRINPNSGVWLLRQSGMASEFLTAVCQIGQQPGPWADQGAILMALGWERGDEQYRGARPGLGNRFLKGTCWLPQSWNQFFTGYPDTLPYFEGMARVANPHVIHFAGMNSQVRYEAMAREINSQRAG